MRRLLLGLLAARLACPAPAFGGNSASSGRNGTVGRAGLPDFTVSSADLGATLDRAAVELGGRMDSLAAAPPDRVTIDALRRAEDGFLDLTELLAPAAVRRAAYEDPERTRAEDQISRAEHVMNEQRARPDLRLQIEALAARLDDLDEGDRSLVLRWRALTREDGGMNSAARPRLLALQDGLHTLERRFERNLDLIAEAERGEISRAPRTPRR